MKIRPIVIAMVAGLLLAVAGANARAVFNPGLNQAGAGADLERGAAHTAETHTAESFGRKEDEGGKHPKCDDGNHSDRGHPGDDCEKSPSKPH